MSTKPIILYDNEYCHVVNNENGTIELIEGPLRFTLPANKSLKTNKRNKLVLKEDEYIILHNPFDEKLKKCVLGRKEIVKGPLVKSLYPDERIDQNKVCKATILAENQGLVIMAVENFEKHKAGEKYIIKGPTSYIPHKYEKIIKTVKAVQVSQNEAIYVRNTLNSKLKMVEGPISYLCGVFEELYKKKLSDDEYEALKLPKIPRERAFQIQVQKGECVCIIDFKTNSEKYVIGPEGYKLGPHEGVKVLSCSGRIPKVENVLKMGVVRLGPDFMSDSFHVRTKDNAVVELLISYKWRFIVDEASKYKIFQADFIGYSCQSMRSRVREEVSRHEFEHFHTDSSGMLRKKLFKNYEIPITKGGKKVNIKFSGRYFSEFNFLIFQLDVKKIRPVDKEIEKLLNESIKSSMKIMCNKKQEAAEMESKKNEIVNKVEIEKMRVNLIKVENANYTKETVEKTKIEGDARLEKAKAECKSETLLRESRLNLEIENLQKKMELLKGEKGDMYIKFIKTNSAKPSQMTVLPTGMRTLIINNGKKKSNSSEKNFGEDDDDEEEDDYD